MTSKGRNTVYSTVLYFLKTPQYPVVVNLRGCTTVPVDTGTAWRLFPKPDGAVLIDADLEESGVQLPHPPQKLAPERGTRHNALAFASVKPGRIAVAISDDGSLTVFRRGTVVLSMP